MSSVHPLDFDWFGNVSGGPSSRHLSVSLIAVVLSLPTCGWTRNKLGATLVVRGFAEDPVEIGAHCGQGRLLLDGRRALPEQVVLAQGSGVSLVESIVLDAGSLEVAAASVAAF
jgi:hypothetical protein